MDVVLKQALIIIFVAERI